MKYLRIILLILLGITFPSSRVSGQADFAITTPEDGAAVMGKVEVRGYIKATNFSSFDLEFSHAGADDLSWFPITTSTGNPSDGLLGIWDTSSIADGDYHLRLTVFYKDLRSAEIKVENIRVRNYTPIETSIPEENLLPSGSGEVSVKPTFPVPANQQIVKAVNDIEINQSDLIKTVLISIAGGIILVVLLAYWFKEKNL